MKGGEYTARLYRAIIDLNLEAQNPRLTQIRFLIEQGMLEEELARDLLLLYDPAIRRAIDHPNPLRRPPTRKELYPNNDAPDIVLGSLVHAPDVEFGLRIKDRPRNVLVGGGGGAGKTTAIARILEGVEQRNRQNPGDHVSALICDKKEDYRWRIQDWGQNCVCLNVHDPATRVSMAPPAGIPAKIWCNQIASVFCALAGLVAAWTCLSSMMQWLVGVMNSTDGTPVRWPSLRLLLELAKSVPMSTWAAKPDYEKSLINQLEAAVQSTDVFDCFGGLDIERDIVQPQKHLLLQMPNMAPSWVRQFLIELLFAQVLYGRIHRGQKTDRTEVIFILDESDQDATAAVDRLFPDGMSPLSQMLRLGREYGIMTVIGLGRLQHASPYVLSEVQYHLILNQSDAASMAMARSTLALPPIADAMFAGLRPGLCVAREAQGPWEHPMLVKINYKPPPPFQHIATYDTHPIIPAQALDQLPDVLAAIRELVTNTHRAELRRTRVRSPDLSRQAHKLLNTAAGHPWAPSAALWKLTGKVPSPDVQKSVRGKLQDAHYADGVEVRLGSANVLLYRITPEGWAFLGLEPPTHVGRGSIAHQHISHWITQCCEMDGHKAACEFIVPGTNHPADCACEVGVGLFDVYEVIVEATDNVVSHLTKLHSSPSVRTITLVCRQKQEVRSLQAALAKEPVVQSLGARLKWELAETYMRRCFP